MLFNSISFLIFFPLVTALYFLLPQVCRWAMLLVASCVFYMWFIPKYILVLVVLIAVDYSAGILIERSAGQAKKVFLSVSVATTCLVLFVFKYFNFFNANLTELAHVLGWNYSAGALRMALPIGLSFHTFQSLSYVIEVYRGNQKAERHLGIYALYVMFYPQLVAGPIERPQNLLHQLREKHDFDTVRATAGLRLILWGLFQKVAVADRLSPLVDQVYGSDPTQANPIAVMVATLFFSFQIYCDFAGYSNIARGAAKVMGVDLMKNFDVPYGARSVAEFWRRWHISLSTWFRDYVYVPLGGSRVSSGRASLNILLVFLISGFWHGAAWGFIVWGGLHGVAVAVEHASKHHFPGLSAGWARMPPIMQGVFGRLLTFGFVTFAWVFFRAKDVATAWEFIRCVGDWCLNAVTFTHGTGALWAFQRLRLGSGVEVAIAVTGVMTVLIVDVVRKSKAIERFDQSAALLRWASYFVAIMMILLFGKYGTSHAFIYFQF